MLRILKKDKSKLTDEEILSRYAKTGDPELSAELFTRYTHMVYGLCMKYFKNREDASDAVMNIYEKLNKDLHKHEIIRFATWLYVLTKNHCLMELRSRSTQNKHHENWVREETFFMESEQILHPIDNGELHAKQLTTCLEQLKSEQKQCIELFYYQNKCYREIAYIMKVDEKQVKSRLQNGKRNLKTCMDHGKQ